MPFFKKILAEIIFFSLIFGCYAASNDEVGKQPTVLHVMLKPHCSGSAEVTLSIYKNLVNAKYPVKILVAKNSYAENTLQQLGLPFYVIDSMKYKKNKKIFASALHDCIFDICKHENIRIIHAHKKFEYEVAKQVADDLKISIVGFYHLFYKPNPKIFKNFDAFMASSPDIADWMVYENKRLNLGIKIVEHFCPPFNEDRIRNFQPPHSNRKEFFKKKFGIDIKNEPIICTVANFFPWKNHKLLFEAIHKLVYEYKTPVQVVLAGTGEADKINDLKNMVKRLKIEDRVYFLGYTPNIPDILFFSDMKVLPSSKEAFGIVLLEAALMKKPIIILKGTGAAGRFIKHEITGLLAKQKDADDLSTQIKRLIQNPELGKSLGENAYWFVRENFSNDILIERIIHMYQKIVQFHKVV